MSFDTILSIVRQALTFGGSYLVTQGYTDSSTITTVVGGLIAAASLAWSIFHHTTTTAVPKA